MNTLRGKRVKYRLTWFCEKEEETNDNNNDDDTNN